MAERSMRRELRHARGLDNLRHAVKARLRRQAVDLAHDYGHVERVWRNVNAVARHAMNEEGWELDGDVLEAATLLHDIGRGFEMPREEHAEASARLAEEMLRNEGLADLVWPVCEVILSHPFKGNRSPNSPEGKVFRDADALDALGALGIARALLTGAARGTPSLYDLADPLGTERELDDTAFVLDHFPIKLFAIVDRMNTAWGKAEAARRTKVVRGFYEALIREATGTR